MSEVNFIEIQGCPLQTHAPSALTAPPPRPCPPPTPPPLSLEGGGWRGRATAPLRRTATLLEVEVQCTHEAPQVLAWRIGLAQLLQDPCF